MEPVLPELPIPPELPVLPPEVPLEPMPPLEAPLLAPMPPLDAPSLELLPPVELPVEPILPLECDPRWRCLLLLWVPPLELLEPVDDAPSDVLDEPPEVVCATSGVANVTTDAETSAIFTNLIITLSKQ